MRRVLFLFLILIVVLPLLALREFASTGTDVLRRLGVSDDMAHDCIWSSFSGMYLSYPNPATLKTLARGDRDAIVKEIGAYAREYTRSDDFGKRYLEYRESRKPSTPKPPKSMEDLRKEQKENLEKSIAGAEESMKSVDAQTRASMKSMIDGLKEQLKSLDDPENPLYSKQMEEYSQQGFEAQKKQYQEELDQWGKKFPPTPSAMIRMWLEKFLSISADVDFNARLKDGLGTSKMFVNPEYEAKPDQWKMCFRAGKETVDAGRAVAQTWLHDLEAEK